MILASLMNSLQISEFCSLYEIVENKIKFQFVILCLFKI